MASSFISDLWHKWNILGFVILSFWLQVFLILFARIRKQTKGNALVLLLWLAYLMADWVVPFVVGLISYNQGNSSNGVAKVEGALQVFWASFLLLHFGGPDTIAAFSLDDSKLWTRHLASFIFQVSAVVYVFVKIFPNDKSLVIPTMLVFLAAIIKNMERTMALYISSLPKLREWVFLYREHFDDVAYMLINEPTVSHLDEKEVNLDESIVVKHAHYFFQMFMVLLGDLMFTFEERAASRTYFQELSAMDALRVISAELQFMYEVLHTKTLAIRSKWSYIFRFIAFTNIVMAFILFNRLKKHKLLELDVKITYSLLFGGIVLDVIALLMLVFSDWTVARIKRFSFLDKFIFVINDLRRPRFAKCEAHPNTNVTYTALDTPLLFRRWSESISACNLLSEYFRKSPRKVLKRSRYWSIISFSSTNNFLNRMVEKILFSLKSCVSKILFIFKTYVCQRHFRVPRIANTKNVSKNPFITDLWIFIFTEVSRKSKNANDDEEVRNIFEARGDLFLKSYQRKIDCGNFLKYVTGADYDANIITWHIATEMWYTKEKPTNKNDEREFSKILSDYMMYLLLNQSNLVSTVAGIAQVRSAKTLQEISSNLNSKLEDVEGLCNHLYQVSLADSPEGSVLYEGIGLAREMEGLEEMKWEVMSGVWVEMLSYAATHIKGETHVQVLSEGGELLVFVWLLMAHFGCLYKPEWGMCTDYWWIHVDDD